MLKVRTTSDLMSALADWGPQRVGSRARAVSSTVASSPDRAPSIYIITSLGPRYSNGPWSPRAFGPQSMTSKAALHQCLRVPEGNAL